jgi:hypothetical protein
MLLLQSSTIAPVGYWYYWAYDSQVPAGPSLAAAIPQT